MTSVKKKVVIVESPAKCNKIEGFLGPGYKCIASYGHFRQLSNLNNIDIDHQFKPTFELMLSKQQNINKMRQFISQADEVFIATDDDREGEAIGWHICDQFNLPVNKTKRILFHEITKTAILNAIKSPTILNMNTINAQKSRQILDLLVGFIVSPYLWKNITHKSKKGLSAGRCQTPALQIIYDNYKDIKNSPGKMVYSTTGHFTKHNIQFVLNHQYTDKNDVEDYLENSVEFDHVFTRGNERNTTKNPPKPFTTSGLQQTSNTELRISPKETMSICQTLYERGYITYMRTDSTTYCKEFIDKSRSFIKEKWGDEYVNPDIEKLSERGDTKEKRKKGKKGKKEKDTNDNNAQEAHEAIRPTSILREVIEEDVTSKERRVYNLIWRNTVESCMSHGKYLGLTSKISAYDEKEYKFSTEQCVFPGWKIVNGYEEVNEIFNFIKSLKQKQILSYNKIYSKVTLKDVKSHLTEAKLVQLLEEKGIGRPSTFSSLVEKIQERDYVKRENIKGKKMTCIDYELTDNELNEIEHEKEFGNEKNKLVIQSLGIMVMEFLNKNFTSLFEYDYTRNMEIELDKIAKGDSIWHDLCQVCYDEIYRLANPLGDSKKIRYVIDDHHDYIVGKHGPVIKYTNGEEVKFMNVKKTLDVEKIKSGNYTLEEMLEETTTNCLGKYQEEDVYIKKGKYGYFIQYGDNKKSLNDIDKEIHDLTLDDVVKIITIPSNILREINENATIRKSKYGHYIYYKLDTMKKPKFISMNNFKGDFMVCDVKEFDKYLINK